MLKYNKQYNIKTYMLCACGCGTEIISKWYHKYYDNPPKYIRGHNPSKYKLKGKNHYNWKGKKIKDGYIQIWNPTHPHNNKGYVFEHRLVVEQYIGRYLESNEHIHHINENRSDNRIENLQIVSLAEHCRIHKPALRGEKK